MKISVLLPYANPHSTGWIDELIRISDKQITVGVVHSVQKYRNNHFEEADNKEGYLYFFKDISNKRKFYASLAEAEYLITLGIFEPWFFRAVLHMPKGLKIWVLSEPFRPNYTKKLWARKCYIYFLRRFKPGFKFSFLCMGGDLVKEQYLSFGFKNSSFYQFGHFPILYPEGKGLVPDISVLKFIFVGKLIPRKGIDILILVLEYLKSTYSNWEFLIVGNGELKDELLPHCLGETKIQYVENISDSGVMKSKFDNSHILVLPSYFDGWGAVVNEAISSCCSLLLSEKVYAGKALLKDGENGFCFNPKEIAGLFLIVDKYFKTPKILNDHFLKSAEIFSEWNYMNAARSFNNLLDGKVEPTNKSLLMKI